MPRKPNTEKHVGVLVETEDTWGRNVVEAICRFGTTARWTVLLAPRDNRGTLRLPQMWSGHGIIASFRNRSLIRHIQALQVPVVDVSNIMEKEGWFARVTTDDRKRTELAIEHLLSRGINQFACYAPSIGRYSDARANDFRTLVESSGASCSVYAAASTNRAGWLTNYDDARDWLQNLPKPVGVFAADPYPARQLVEICAMNDILVPDEVAIISGDDDDLLCNVATPRITSIELASSQIGETAARVLKRLMSGRPVPQRTMLISPIGVRKRQSTDTLAIDDPEIVNALTFIRDRAGEAISVQDVAHACHLSRRSLEQRFREKLNRGPGEEIRRVRMEYVQQLLLDSQDSISSIAFQSGFASGASLCQAYQKYFGESPGEYRRSRSS